MSLSFLGEGSGARIGEPISIEHDIVPQVVNGQDAQEGAWPWTVSLNRKSITDGQSYFSPICGAVLIHKDFVVTAKHCLEIK